MVIDLLMLFCVPTVTLNANDTVLQMSFRTPVSRYTLGFKVIATGMD